MSKEAAEQTQTRLDVGLRGGGRDRIGIGSQQDAAGKARVWGEERGRGPTYPWLQKVCVTRRVCLLCAEGECVGVSTGQELVGSSSLDAGGDGGIMGLKRVVSLEERKRLSHKSRRRPGW